MTIVTELGSLISSSSKDFIFEAVASYFVVVFSFALIYSCSWPELMRDFKADLGPGMSTSCNCDASSFSYHFFMLMLKSFLFSNLVKSCKTGAY